MYIKWNGPDLSAQNVYLDGCKFYYNFTIIINRNNCQTFFSFLVEAQRNYAEGKDKLLVSVNSHCQTPDGVRENFVRALNRITKVDVHGECGGIFGRITCPRWSERCKISLKSYKFYISLENSICNDYVTEKYWDVPFDHDTVPIVLGLEFFKELAIPVSYIDATAFPDLNSLVKYLKYLDGNDTAYNEYFKWRQFYHTANLEPWPCRLCRMLHDDSLPAKSYKRFDQFLDPYMVCTKELNKYVVNY